MFKLATGRGLFGVAMVGAVLCVGCDSSQEQSPETYSLPKATNVAASPLPPEMVAAVAANKGETPITLHFALKSPPKSGEPLDVEIAMLPRQVLEKLSVTFEVTEGMHLVSGASFAEQQNVQPEKPVSHRITLMPSGDGVFIVTATAQVESADGSAGSTFSFPVIVGGLPSAPVAGTPAGAAKPANP